MQKHLTTDFEFDATTETAAVSSFSIAKIVKYASAGVYFGVVLVQAQVVSWFRIQEMFRFQSFHMYGVIGSAVVTGAISVWIIRRFKIKSIEKESIATPPKTFHKGLVAGGLCFGVGWALTGACPGPIFAQIGMGFSTSWIVLISALIGTFVYGAIREKLPH